MTERGAFAGTAVLALVGALLLALGVAGVGAALVLLAVLLLVGAAVGPARRPGPGRGEVVVPRPAGPDRSALAARSRRAAAALTDPARFDRELGPELVLLARERLARRHGVDPDRDPDRARALLGDPLWSLVDPGRAGAPARLHDERDLAAVLARLEAL